MRNILLHDMGIFPVKPTEAYSWRNKVDSVDRMLKATTTSVLIQQTGMLCA